MVTIRSPFCGYDITKCVELNVEDLSRYSNKNEPVSLRKCPHDHRPTTKAFSSAITVTNISQSFYLQDGGKNQLAYRYGLWNKVTWLSCCAFTVSSLYIRVSAMPSVLWRCWLGGRKGIRPVKNWVVRCWYGYLAGARCRLAYGPADATATHCLLL